MPPIDRNKPQNSSFWCPKTMTSSKQIRSEMADLDSRAASDAHKPSLALHIVDGVERLVLDAIKSTQPLEIDPSRSQLFGFFVAADEAGLIADDSNVGVFDGFEEESSVTDLSADSLCRLLARRWGLDMAAREAQALQFSCAHPDIATTVAGSANPVNIRNWAKWLAEPMDESLLKDVLAIFEPVKNLGAPGRIERE